MTHVFSKVMAFLPVLAIGLLTLAQLPHTHDHDADHGSLQQAECIQCFLGDTSDNADALVTKNIYPDPTRQPTTTEYTGHVNREQPIGSFLVRAPPTA